jgi:hypothetical protein
MTQYFELLEQYNREECGFSKHYAVQTGYVAPLCLILGKSIVFTLLALLGYAVAQLVEALRCEPKVAGSIRDVIFH